MAWNGLVLTVDGRNALNEAQLSDCQRMAEAIDFVDGSIVIKELSTNN